MSPATNLATSFNVISNNILGAADSSIDWAVAVDPQNNTGSQVEGVTDVIVENNQFYRNKSGGPKDITRGGRRITSRGNTSVNGSLIVDQHENRMNVPSGWDGPYFNK